MDDSKKITHNDESSKDFIMKCLGNDETHGFDIDSIYFYNDKWLVFEYLKCESKFVNPHTSDPNRYPWNWKKFLSLFNVADMLNGKLVLVNYSDRAIDSNMVRVMIVDRIDYAQLNKCKYFNESVTTNEKINYIKYEKDYKFSFEEFSKWLKYINEHSTMKIKNGGNING